MSAATWSDAWLAHAAVASRELWRGVEAQYRVATMHLVDNLLEQQLLEQALEDSKPALPPHAADLDFLIFTPFRYTSPHPSRFRRANEPGLWYGSDEPQTVCAELAYWRHRFIIDSDALRDAQVVTEHTFFQAHFAGLELDLTVPPMNGLREAWRHPSNYDECHRLAAKVRSSDPAIAAIRYESARRDHSTCAAVFVPRALSLVALHRQQTWICKTTAELVLWSHDGEAYEFDATRWHA